MDQALEQGWKQGVPRDVDGIISRQEEEQLRAFRDSLALEDTTPTPRTWAPWTGHQRTAS